MTVVTTKNRVLPAAASSLTPSGVSSTAQAITSATGKPTISTKMNTRSAHSGAWNVGNAMLAAWITSHATTR